MIHKKAEVKDSKLGDGCKVWQFASVIRGAELGDNVTVASCAIVDGAKVGADSIICHGASVHPGAVLGREVFVGPGVTICNDSWPRAHKRGWAIPERPVVIVEDGASIGANCVVLPGVRIGAGAMIAAGVTVTRDVIAGHLMGPTGAQAPIGPDPNKVRMRYPGERIR
jgi:UDP-2-acetamido-3-amino-2,3-dideoxy-glucuronate N-acetyltransferase